MVLLPHATVPLHIFEPRYRQLMRDALAGPKLMAMATFSGEKWKRDYQNNPPIREHVCVGYIVRHQELDDGRYNLLLQGICRARIEQEIPHQPYRRALLHPIETQPMMEIDLSDERQRIESLLRNPPLKQLASVAAINQWLGSDVPTTALIDLAVMTICDNAEQRYSMLCEADPHARASWLEGQLLGIRRTLRIAEHFSPPEAGDYVSLN